ncbi:rRNA processing protein [Coemansia javaensis]|uniref:Pre-rRNA-processing protein n=1 Tax=Coemansia javaensis TaxID=2761396 RepID=A0A9W8H7V1_9FUNG|nr:rRNA processing protein [Coemansia javaensis]
MPKATRKKKQQKAEDFKKVKLKVGKKKAPASNATDTSFTARAIVLSEQSIVADKSAQATNSRNQTLRELLTQLRHYSATTRREAVGGLAELIAMHGSVLRAELGPIVEGSVRLVVDSEAGVRRQLLRLYGDVLPAIPAGDLAPFVPLAAVFVCSAMTHILDDVRADAMRFLDLLTDVAPGPMAQHSARILPSLLSLLETTTPAPDAANGAAGGGGGGRAQVSARTALLTQGSRLGIMRSCRRYLAAYTGCAHAADADPLRFMGAAAEPSRPPGSRISDLYFCPDSPAPFGALNLFGELSGGRAESAVCAQSRAALDRLFPFLQATWAEESPVFAASTVAPGPSLELCTLALQILQTLWRAAYPGALPPDEKRLPAFLRRCMAAFPLGGGGVGSATSAGPGADEALLSLNVMLCELAALTGAAGAQFQARAIDFAVQAMGARHLQHPQFAELLPVAWRLAGAGDPDDAERLLAAAVQYGRACPVGSASKALCIRFLSRAIQDHWARAPVPGALSLAAPRLAALAAAWVQALPRLLWQLRDRNLDASAAAVDALRLAVQRTRLLDAAGLDALHAGLATLFCVSVPGKGAVHGPFRQYPPALQRAVLEAVGCLPAPPEALLAAARASLAELPLPLPPRVAAVAATVGVHAIGAGS